MDDTEGKIQGGDQGEEGVLLEDQGEDEVEDGGDLLEARGEGEDVDNRPDMGGLEDSDQSTEDTGGVSWRPERLSEIQERSPINLRPRSI